MQISFVMLLFSDQISGRGKSFEGGKLPQGGAPLWKKARTIEHTEMLTYTINHARKRQRDLVITLIDLQNAFGEVHHSLLRRVPDFHYIPHELRELILEMYRDFYVTIGTMGYTTCPIKVERGIMLQGDCLSPLLFNLCFNTLIQTAKQRKVNCLDLRI